MSIEGQQPGRGAPDTPNSKDGPASHSVPRLLGCLQEPASAAECEPCSGTELLELESLTCRLELVSTQTQGKGNGIPMVHLSLPLPEQGTSPQQADTGSIGKLVGFQAVFL